MGAYDVSTTLTSNHDAAVYTVHLTVNYKLRLTTGAGVSAILTVILRQSLSLDAMVGTVCARLPCFFYACNKSRNLLIISPVHRKTIKTSPKLRSLKACRVASMSKHGVLRHRQPSAMQIVLTRLLLPNYTKLFAALGLTHCAHVPNRPQQTQFFHL